MPYKGYKDKERRRLYLREFYRDYREKNREKLREYWRAREAKKREKNKEAS